MKRLGRSILGVTLLEIMLVLAIAAMIIVMSVRYYNTANTSQQANAYLQQVEAIVAAANQMSQGTGSYSGATTSAIQAILGTNGLTPPWGGTSPLAVKPTAGGLAITPASTPPAGICALVAGQLSGNPNYTATNCTITYSLTTGG